ncbi:hypothetical protein N7457_001827 [Penicillium paradoxum]|uniref:uncharacterized protein n=1 Tax=Penicillium paradoxum TaxID=176176 RepID=UPI002548FC5F|nr:uncharacterized protein N7457_001827 [Penicillium paradoxum]KAJ5795228.1 hypothetical protein N7457_001827 [Penicillium paradoxum]
MDILRPDLNTSQPSSSELSLVEYESEDPLAQLAKELNPQLFDTNVRLRRSLEHRRRALEQGQTQDQYLVFTSVPPAQSSRLSDDQSRTSKYSRIYFNAKTGIMIAKVMPNLAHELAIR